MDMGGDSPSGRLQHGDQAARLRWHSPGPAPPGHHPGDLSRAGRRTARGQRRLHDPGRADSADADHHPVAPQLITPGQRRAAGELTQGRIVQQRREFGRMSHDQRLQVKPLK